MAANISQKRRRNLPARDKQSLESHLARSAALREPSASISSLSMRVSPTQQQRATRPISSKLRQVLDAGEAVRRAIRVLRMTTSTKPSMKRWITFDPGLMRIVLDSNVLVRATIPARMGQRLFLRALIIPPPHVLLISPFILVGAGSRSALRAREADPQRNDG